jgi:hypothetical protein
MIKLITFLGKIEYFEEHKVTVLISIAKNNFLFIILNNKSTNNQKRSLTINPKKGSQFLILFNINS